MFTGVYSAASALRAAEIQQDVIATNLAHMNVPGYRRSVLSFAALADELESGNTSPAGYGHAVDTLDIDYSAGPIADTGRSLDVAIVGDGFFAVQGDNGELLTRSGSFHVDPEGYLAGNNGMRVLGERGPVSVPNNISPGQITIGDDGTITVGSQQLGKLRIVAVEDNTQLIPVGTTLFAADQATTVEADATVIQGMREQSNVQPVDELISMILATRYHEAAQRALKSIDDVTELQTNPQG